MLDSHHLFHPGEGFLRRSYVNLSLALVMIGVFFLPVSVSLNNGIGVGALLYCLLGDWRVLGRLIVSFRSHWLMMAFIVWAMLSMLWSPVGGWEQVSGVWKYAHKLIILWLLLPVFLDRRVARWASWLLQMSVMVCVVAQITATIWYPVLPAKWMHAMAPIQLSVLVAFVAFLRLHAWAERGASVWNVMGFFLLFWFEYFINIERTGMVVFAGLALLFCYQRMGWKACVGLMMCLPLMVGLLLQFSPRFEHRMRDIVQDIEQLPAPTSPDLATNSTGLRLTFAKFCLQSIAIHPLLGRGIGAFKQDYQRSGWTTIDHQGFVNDPENSYLHVGYELGIVGLLLFVGWLFAQFVEARSLLSTARFRVQGVVCTFALSALFISSLNDNRMTAFYVLGVALWFMCKVQKENMMSAKCSGDTVLKGAVET